MNLNQADLRATLGGPVVHDEEIRIISSIQDDRSLLMRLPFHAALTCGPGLGVDYGPIVTLLDTISGITALHGLRYTESTATLDLRIDFLTPAAGEQDIVAEAEVSQVLGTPSHGSVLIRAEARSADGHPIARATGRFFRKDLPKLNGMHGYVSEHALEKFADYQSFMGLVALGGGASRLPYRIGLIGNGAVPSLHGGVLAAHLLESARDLMRDTSTPRPATAHFTFERYGLTRDVIATAKVEKAGRAVSFVSSTSSQPGSEQPIARATFTFVAC